MRNNNRKKKKINIAVIVSLLVILAAAAGVVTAEKMKEKQPETEEKNIGEVYQLFLDEQVQTAELTAENKLLVTLKDKTETTCDIRSEIEFTTFFADIIQEQLKSGTLESFKITDLSSTRSNIMLLIDISSTVILLVMIAYILVKTTGGSANTKFKRAGGQKVTFEDVAGLAEEKQELGDIIAFLREPKKFRSAGVKVPHGILLEGEPGTGKTLLAKAAAGEADVPFYAASGSDFVEIFAGMGPLRVRKLFAEARKQKAAIIFIDEIDGVGHSRSRANGNGEEDRTLNQLLVEMDGFNENDNIVVIAATNRSDMLDKALLRPGRFDKKITVSLPDAQERLEIIKLHAKGKKFAEDIDYEKLAKETGGMSGADIANVINEAAFAAAKQDSGPVTQENVLDAILKQSAGLEKKNRKLSVEDRKRTAYHEAGHAVVSKYLHMTSDYRKTVTRISIIPRGVSGGMTVYSGDGDILYYTETELQNELLVLLSGRAAEEVILDSISSGAEDDLRQATKIAERMVGKWGMKRKFGLGSFSEVSTVNSWQMRDAVNDILDKAIQKATDIVCNNKTGITILAEHLLKNDTITEEKLNKMLEDYGNFAPLKDYGDVRFKHFLTEDNS